MQLADTYYHFKVRFGGRDLRFLLPLKGGPCRATAELGNVKDMQIDKPH